MIKDLSNIKDSMFKFRRERVAMEYMVDNAAATNVNIGTIKFTSADGVTEKVVKTV